jgi:hypothetical protein
MLGVCLGFSGQSVSNGGKREALSIEHRRGEVEEVICESN